MAKHIGTQSILLTRQVSIIEATSTVGKKEGEGPLRQYFDVVLDDNKDNGSNWEQAESNIVRDNLNLLIKKSGLKKEKINYVITGDLLNQCCGSTYGIRDLNIPFFGVFGACSTFGEALSLGSIIIDGGGGENIIAAASSHFCSAERQFRFPLELGTQRPPTSTYTVTGDGGVMLSANGFGPYVTAVTTGKIVDFGITDANNMGAAMAPAAADVMLHHFKDFNRDPNYYDLIATGDLGYVGKELVIKIMAENGYYLGSNYTDCGIEIFYNKKQDTHSGGSGCACSAVVFSGMLYKKLKTKEINRLLLIPTGALMNTTVIQQGESIAGIAHAVAVENTF